MSIIFFVLESLVGVSRSSVINFRTKYQPGRHQVFRIPPIIFGRQKSAPLFSNKAREAWSAKISLVILSLEARLSKVSSVVLFGVSYAHAGGLCYAVPSLYPGRSAQPEGG